MPLLEAPKGHILVINGFTAWYERKGRKSRKAPAVALKDKEAFTLTEVGELLGISRQTVTSLITIKHRRQTSPLLRTIRVANAIRVTRADLDTYILATRISAGISTND